MGRATLGLFAGAAAPRPPRKGVLTGRSLGVRTAFLIASASASPVY